MVILPSVVITISVTMDLDVFLARDALFDQEFHNVTPVVTLQLNDGAPFLVLVSGSIAAPGLLKSANHFLEIQVVRQSLDQSVAFTCRALLEVQV